MMRIFDTVVPGVTVSLNLKYTIEEHAIFSAPKIYVDSGHKKISDELRNFITYSVVCIRNYIKAYGSEIARSKPNLIKYYQYSVDYMKLVVEPYLRSGDSNLINCRVEVHSFKYVQELPKLLLWSSILNPHGPVRTRYLIEKVLILWLILALANRMMTYLSNEQHPVLTAYFKLFHQCLV